MNNPQRKGPKKPMETAKRLLKYVTGTYKAEFIFVFVCILVCSIATISVSISMKFLLDDYIIPLMGQANPNFAGLYQALAVLACIFCAGNNGILLLQQADGKDWPRCSQTDQG